MQVMMAAKKAFLVLPTKVTMAARGVLMVSFTR